MDTSTSSKTLSLWQVQSPIPYHSHSYLTSLNTTTPGYLSYKVRRGYGVAWAVLTYRKLKAIHVTKANHTPNTNKYQIGVWLQFGWGISTTRNPSFGSSKTIRGREVGGGFDIDQERVGRDGHTRQHHTTHSRHVIRRFHSLITQVFPKLYSPQTLRQLILLHNALSIPPSLGHP